MEAPDRWPVAGGACERAPMVLSRTSNRNGVTISTASMAAALAVRPVPDPFADPLHGPLGDGRLVRVDRRQRRDRVRAFLAAVLGTAVGVLLRNVISNIINQVGGLDSNIQSAIGGAFLLVVVVLQQVLSGGSVRLRRRR